MAKRKIQKKVVANMNAATLAKKMSAAAMVAAMMASTAVPAFAASSTNANNNVATTNDLNNSDIIDMSKTGSLSIYKYDITSAEEDGAYTAGSVAATGEADSGLETTLADYAIKGVQFTYLRVGNVETHSVQTADGNEIQLVYEIPTALASILGLTADDAVDMTGGANPCSNTGIYHYTSQQLSDALQAILESDNIAAKDALEEYVIADTNSVQMDLTDENGHTSVDGLQLGLYLLVETEVPEEVVDTVNPWFVQLPFTDVDGEEWLYDMTCYPKNQTGNPTLDKLVRNAHGTAASAAGSYEDYSKLVTNSDESDEEFVAARDEYTYDSTVTASEGDVLDYILVSKIPHVTSEATYLSQYTFTDVLSEGQTYNQDVQIAFYENKDDAEVNNTNNAAEVWNLKSTAFKSEYVEVTSGTTKTGETQLTVTFTDTGLELLNKTYHDYYIVVYYTTTVNSDATAVLGDDGNPNDVKLTWERTSAGYYDTLEDECIVYTYGIDLTKEFSDKAGDPTKVQFVLYDEDDAYYVVAANTGTTEDGKKVYYMTGKTTEKSEATVFSPDENGSLVINGLEADTYQLTEIATDTGYSILKDEIVIDITSAEREITAAVAGRIAWDATAADDANGHGQGRTTGKTDMVVGDLTASCATVDGVAAEMANYVVNDQRETPCDSANALVNIGITNSKSFQLPVTGGAGLYAITIIGVLTVAAGCYVVVKKQKKTT